MISQTHLLPRVYTRENLSSGLEINPTKDQAHKIFNVLRLVDGKNVRVFNGKDGEWLCEILSRKLLVKELLREQNDKSSGATILFAPIKKDRCSTLISQTVEMGARELRPIKTARTLGQSIKSLSCERLLTKVIQASQQSERLSIPSVSEIKDLKDALTLWPKDKDLYICLERGAQSEYIGDVKLSKNCGFLIGAEGGFSDCEIDFLLKSVEANENHHAICLGEEILRSETAAALCMASYKLQKW